MIIINILSFFGGILAANILDTSLGEFNEWASVGAALIIASLESISKIYYSRIQYFRKSIIKNYYIIWLLSILNYFKLGIIYGLIIDAFKLGS
jgi:hypothetical protein|tara:strand:- start:40355 stop:40633 length:279 start_codon:yes stop_codon:yes gene_type:complete